MVLYAHVVSSVICCQSLLCSIKEKRMRRHGVQSWYLFLLAVCLFVPAPAVAHPTHVHVLSARHTLADFPTVDPNYTYDQLFYVATHFQHREAGYDANLPVSVNGHDEFATYWAQEMVHNLQGFGAQVRNDQFKVPGWRGRLATVPAFNVEVSVP